MRNTQIDFNKFSCTYWALGILFILPFSMYNLNISKATLSEWVMFFGLSFLLFKSRKKFYISKDLALFLKTMCVFFMLTIISYIIRREIQPIFIVRSLRLVVFLFFIVFAYNFIDKDVLLKYLRTVSIIAALYILLQYLAYHVLGIYLSNQLLPLPVNREVTEDTLMILFNKYYFRATGFFAEPSYAAKFIIPGFAYCLFGWHKNKIDILGCIIITFAVFCTTSLQGLIFIFFMAVFRFICFLIEKRISFKTIMITTICLICVFLLFYLFLKQSESGFIIARLEKIFALDFTAGSSASFRLLRGYSIFKQLPLTFQIIGIGSGGIAEYILQNGIYTPYDINFNTMTMAAVGYVNGISVIMISSGMVGFCFFAFCFYKLFINSTITNKLILLTYVLALFSGGGIFDLFMVYILTVIFVGNKRKMPISTPVSSFNCLRG